MPNQVCMGAQMMCTFGMAPSALVVLPVGKFTFTDQMPDANIMDHVPMTEHHAVRNVHVAGEPHGGSGHRRGAWRAHSDALHSGYARALGYRRHLARWCCWGISLRSITSPP